VGDDAAASGGCRLPASKKAPSSKPAFTQALVGRKSEQDDKHGVKPPCEGKLEGL